MSNPYRPLNDGSLPEVLAEVPAVNDLLGDDPQAGMSRKSAMETST